MKNKSREIFSNTPSEEKGRFDGERGNSLYRPNDPTQIQLCDNVGVESISFYRGCPDLRAFSAKFNGINLIGDIPMPNNKRTDNPLSSFHKMDRTKPTKYGEDIKDKEYKKNNLRPLHLVGTNDQNQRAIINESKVPGDFVIRGSLEASNYNQAYASVANQMDWAESDVKLLVEISQKPNYKNRDEDIRNIAERNGISEDEIRQFTSRPLVVHEQLYLDSEGRERACGVIMDRKWHEAFAHKGLVGNMNERRDTDPFVNVPYEEGHGHEGQNNSSKSSEDSTKVRGNSNRRDDLEHKSSNDSENKNDYQSNLSIDNFEDNEPISQIKSNLLEEKKGIDYYSKLDSTESDKQQKEKGIDYYSKLDPVESSKLSKENTKEKSIENNVNRDADANTKSRVQGM